MIAFIVTIAFTILIYKGLSKTIRLADAFSTLLARKYSPKELGYRELKIAFRSSIYIALLIVLTGLYWPLISSVHPALYGVLLIFVVIMIFVQLLRIVTLGSPAIISWLKGSSKK